MSLQLYVAHGGKEFVFNSEWIVVNPDDIAKADSACVIEVRNAPKGTPHFVYFLIDKTIEDLKRDPDLNEIDQAILDIYPDYQAILDAKVEPILDENRHCINGEEFLASPEPGYFNLVPIPGSERTRLS